MILVMMISGCGDGSTQPKQNENYYKGTQGIVMRFLPNLPPDTIYVSGSGSDLIASDEYEYKIEVQNKGAFPQSNAGDTTHLYVCLSGYDPNLLTQGGNEKITPKLINNLNLLGKSISNPTGEIAIYPLTAEKIKFHIPSTADSYTTTMKATAYYSYHTIYSTEICMDPDPSKNEEDTCKVGNIASTGGQGAPVVITGIDVTPAGGKTIIKIKVQNAGSGQVVDRRKKSEWTCDKSLSYGDYDSVKLVSVRLGDQLINNFDNGICKPAKLRLIDGKGTIYCSITPSQTTGPAYKSVFVANLDYGYKDSISKNIEVKQI